MPLSDRNEEKGFVISIVYSYVVPINTSRIFFHRVTLLVLPLIDFS